MSPVGAWLRVDDARLRPTRAITIGFEPTVQSHALCTGRCKKIPAHNQTYRHSYEGKRRGGASIPVVVC